MKKIISIAVLCVLALSVLGCGNAPQKSAEPDPAQTVYVQTGTEANKAEEKNKQETVQNKGEEDQEITVESGKSYGDFCSLQTAYTQGKITKAELMSIAYYQNGGKEYNETIMAEHYVPLSKIPQILSKTTQNKIKETVAYKARNRVKNPIEEARAEQVVILGYYGTYNGYVALMIGGFDGYDCAVWDISIDEVVFHYRNGNRITLWKEKDAIEAGAINVSETERANNREENVTQKEGDNVIFQTKEEEWAYRDAQILAYYREPSIEDDFYDNEIFVVLKWKYVESLSSIGLTDFWTTNFHFVALYDYDRKITNPAIRIKYSGGKIKRGYQLTLEVPGKEKVLLAIEELKNLEIVLAAEPIYQYKDISD